MLLRSSFRTSKAPHNGERYGSDKALNFTSFFLKITDDASYINIQFQIVYLEYIYHRLGA